ncbi:hypothetical protein CCFV1_ORF018 [Cotesia congregata filamentous virus 1]|uniref:Uncharacterized protein n=1 Tax=Cotesia congregata filamentous virus 1 TaxID=3064291 RepID=A0ABC8QJK4_9VIRU|nr:hypothetical protein CCFV1_ORF018 [Cotesia congregata filamentous virus 1]
MITFFYNSRFYTGFFNYDRDWSYMSVTLSIPGFFNYDRDWSYMNVTPAIGFFNYDRDRSYRSVTPAIGFFNYDHDRSYRSVTPAIGFFHCDHDRSYRSAPMLPRNTLDRHYRPPPVWSARPTLSVVRHRLMGFHPRTPAPHPLAHV